MIIYNIHVLQCYDGGGSIFAIYGSDKIYEMGDRNSSLFLLKTAHTWAVSEWLPLYLVVPLPVVEDTAGNDGE